MIDCSPGAAGGGDRRVFATRTPPTDAGGRWLAHPRTMPRKRKGGKSRGTPRASAPAPAPAAAQVPGPTSASGPGHPKSLSRPRIDGTARGKAQGTQAAPAVKRGTRTASPGGRNAEGEADGASVGTSTSGRWRLTWQQFLVAVTVGVALGGTRGHLHEGSAARLREWWICAGAGLLVLGLTLHDVGVRSPAHLHA